MLHWLHIEPAWLKRLNSLNKIEKERKKEEIKVQRNASFLFEKIFVQFNGFVTFFSVSVIALLKKEF